MKKLTFAFALLVTACSGATRPEDVASAAQQCAEHGGWATVARFERGRVLTVTCVDGLQLEVRKEKP